MKRFKKICLLFLTISLVIGSFYSWGWAESDPIKDEWNAMDLILARPIGLAAAIVGVGIFTISLPFTLSVDIISRISGSPTFAIRDSANMLMLEPLKFSFVRQFPDENM